MGDGRPLEQAQAAAGDRKVHVAGGARTIQQYLAAGLVDELSLHLAPVLLGGGVRLFEELGTPLPRFEQLQARDSPHAVHLRYRVL